MGQIKNIKLHIVTDIKLKTNMDRNHLFVVCSFLSVISFIHTTEEIHYDGKLKIIDTFPTGQCEITVQEGDLVTWKSHGYLESGHLFDVGEYEVKIGSDEAPVGIDQGLRGLCYGDQRGLRIHPDLAYGDDGLDDRVPANSIVI